MGRVHIFSLVAFLVISISAFAQASGAADNNKPGAEMATSGMIKVLSPKVNERLGSSAVIIRFQLEASGAAADSMPTYRVHLDGRNPVETTSTEHSFAGLTDGEHVISIDLVDANHVPVPLSHTEVRFQTYTPTTNNKVSSATSVRNVPPTVKANWELPASEGHPDLPTGATELPLLSMVGFGVLVGGVISAMRTRR